MKKSNIEILRIIAFLMVCVIHITSVVLVDNLLVKNSLNWYYAIIMRSIAAPAICIFIIISGYLTGKKYEKNPKAPFKRLFIPLMCYLPVLIYVDYKITNSIVLTINNMISFTGYFYHLWYILVYSVIIFIIYNLKKYIKLNKKSYLKIIFFMLGIITISSTIMNIFNINIFYNYFANNIFIYMLILYFFGIIVGNYDIKFKKKYSLIVYLLSILSNILIYINFGEILTFITSTTQIFNCVSAISLFMFFKDINIKSSKFINWIGSLTFGGYIIHVFFISYLQKIFPYLLNVKKTNYFIYDLLFILFVAAVSLITEQTRIWIVNIIKKVCKNLQKELS